jgi:hypothetical protein
MNGTQHRSRLPEPKPREQLVHCDGVGCEETYPRFHDENGPGFTDGKWLGWFYLDLNRPDLRTGPLRFCGMRCLLWWLSETQMPLMGAYQEEAMGILAYMGSKRRERQEKA